MWELITNTFLFLFYSFMTETYPLFQNTSIESAIGVYTATSKELEGKIAHLWEDCDLLVKYAATNHPLKNIAKFEVVVQEECFPDNLNMVFEPKVSFVYSSIQV